MLTSKAGITLYGTVCLVSVPSPGNLPYSSTEDDVLQFLHLSSQHATVELATARDNPSRKLGFGFVNVPVEKVEAVLKYNGAILGERSIKG